MKEVKAPPIEPREIFTLEDIRKAAEASNEEQRRFYYDVWATQDQIIKKPESWWKRLKNKMESWIDDNL